MCRSVLVGMFAGGLLLLLLLDLAGVRWAGEEKPPRRFCLQGVACVMLHLHVRPVSLPAMPTVRRPASWLQRWAGGSSQSSICGV